MPLFKYVAMDENGQKLQGTLNSGSRNQLLATIREKGWYPVDVQEEETSKNADVFEALRRVKLKDIAIFCRQFHTMLNAGITVIQCLDILQEQTENKKLKAICNNVYDSVQKGQSLSDSLKEYPNIFPQLLLSMVDAGEQSGTLDMVMERMAMHFEKENKIRNKVRSSMIYPIILSVAAVLVVIFLLTFVMPTFFGMFENSNVPLPAPTLLLLDISAFLRKYWHITFGAIFIFAYVFIKYIKTEKGKYNWDSLKIKIPVVKGVIVKTATARFTRTMSTLLSSGIPLIQALESAAAVVGNVVASKGIMEVRKDMRKGMNLSGPLKRMDFFPPMIDSMIKIGEESGSLDIILNKTADFYDEEVETAMQKLVTMLEPLMIVLMAAVVGFIVISIVLPMFDMYKTIGT